MSWITDFLLFIFTSILVFGAPFFVAGYSACKTVVLLENTQEWKKFSLLLAAFASSFGMTLIYFTTVELLISIIDLKIVWLLGGHFIWDTLFFSVFVVVLLSLPSQEEAVK